MHIYTCAPNSVEMRRPASGIWLIVPRSHTDTNTNAIFLLTLAGAINMCVSGVYAAVVAAVAAFFRLFVATTAFLVFALEQLSRAWKPLTHILCTQSVWQNAPIIVCLFLPVFLISFVSPFFSPGCRQQRRRRPLAFDWSF